MQLFYSVVVEVMSYWCMHLIVIVVIWIRHKRINVKYWHNDQDAIFHFIVNVLCQSFQHTHVLHELRRGVLLTCGSGPVGWTWLEPNHQFHQRKWWMDASGMPVRNSIQIQLVKICIIFRPLTEKDTDINLIYSVSNINVSKYSVLVWKYLLSKKICNWIQLRGSKPPQTRWRKKASLKARCTLMRTLVYLVKQ